ncbi:hypothetical protein HYALB_00001837 [Hymenoscyphus albidus]|uniref:AB hydrolase-1 domain-containing protein n=1 Tax=Hymenoscyphus albidus TaxID=595503 RepID=A0A9N9Q8K7_9HELO|nr:hypothetical protein HYALB_00001837 [Hymenoscyphus albidus]
MSSFQSTSIILFLFFATQALAVPHYSTDTSPNIEWRTCKENDPPNLQCGQIKVPINHEDPHGGHFNLGFARLKSNSMSTIGNLIYNPGGPGGAGSAEVFAQAFLNVSIWTLELLAHYDIIGLDPRGTGLSNAMKCDPDIWNRRVSGTPKNKDEFKKLVAYNKAFGESCRNLTGPVFDFMDTESAAKDMDLVRKALGEEKLTFYGQSYGSQLGSTYAGLFPKNVGRMVLDGVMDSSQSSVAQVAMESNNGYETTLNKFFQWCNTTAECALNGQDIAGIFDKMIATAESSPIPAPGCAPEGDKACRSDATSEEILAQVQIGLLGFSASSVFLGWPALSGAIAQAAQGNATLLSRPIKNTSSHADFSFLGVGCKDWIAASKSYIDLVLIRQMTGILSPHSRGNSQFYEIQSSCIGWPSPPTNNPHTLDPKKVAQLPPILLVNSFWDPSTPISSANALKTKIPNSVLILRNGSGHTSYLTFGKTTEAIDAFFVKGILPAQGTTFAY